MTDFDTFWNLYPRKVAKLEVRDRCWPRALKHDTAEAIIAGLEAQLPMFRGVDKQFIPHPSTWLNKGRWLDEVENPTPAVDRLYDTWTDAEKQECADIVVRWGERWATHNFRYLKTDIDRLRAEGRLQPREVTG